MERIVLKIIDIYLIIGKGIEKFIMFILLLYIGLVQRRVEFKGGMGVYFYKENLQNFFKNKEENESLGILDNW